MSTFIYRGAYYGGGFFREHKEPIYTILHESEGTFIYQGAYYGGGLFREYKEPIYTILIEND